MCELHYSICTNKHDDKCCSCGKFVKKQNRNKRENPYVKAIVKESFLHIICDNCYIRSVDSI